MWLILVATCLVLVHHVVHGISVVQSGVDEIAMVPAEPSIGFSAVEQHINETKAVCMQFRFCVLGYLSASNVPYWLDSGYPSQEHYKSAYYVGIESNGKAKDALLDTTRLKAHCAVSSSTLKESMAADSATVSRRDVNWETFGGGLVLVGDTPAAQLCDFTALFYYNGSHDTLRNEFRAGPKVKIGRKTALPPSVCTLSTREYHVPAKPGALAAKVIVKAPRLSSCAHRVEDLLGELGIEVEKPLRIGGWQVESLREESEGAKKNKTAELGAAGVLTSGIPQIGALQGSRISPNTVAALKAHTTVFETDDVSLGQERLQHCKTLLACVSSRMAVEGRAVHWWLDGYTLAGQVLNRDLLPIAKDLEVGTTAAFARTWLQMWSHQPENTRACVHPVDPTEEDGAYGWKFGVAILNNDNGKWVSGASNLLQNQTSRDSLSIQIWMCKASSTDDGSECIAGNVNAPSSMGAAPDTAQCSMQVYVYGMQEGSKAWAHTAERAGGPVTVASTDSIFPDGECEIGSSRARCPQYPKQLLRLSLHLPAHSAQAFLQCLPYSAEDYTLNAEKSECVTLGAVFKAPMSNRTLGGAPSADSIPTRVLDALHSTIPISNTTTTTIPTTSSTPATKQGDLDEDSSTDGTSLDSEGSDASSTDDDSFSKLGPQIPVVRTRIALSAATTTTKTLQVQSKESENESSSESGNTNTEPSVESEKTLDSKVIGKGNGQGKGKGEGKGSGKGKGKGKKGEGLDGPNPMPNSSGKEEISSSDAHFLGSERPDKATVSEDSKSTTETSSDSSSESMTSEAVSLGGKKIADVSPRLSGSGSGTDDWTKNDGDDDSSDEEDDYSDITPVEKQGNMANGAKASPEAVAMSPADDLFAKLSGLVAVSDNELPSVADEATKNPPSVTRIGEGSGSDPSSSDTSSSDLSSAGNASSTTTTTTTATTSSSTTTTEGVRKFTFAHGRYTRANTTWQRAPRPPYQPKAVRPPPPSRLNVLPTQPVAVPSDSGIVINLEDFLEWDAFVTLLRNFGLEINSLLILIGGSFVCLGLLCCVLCPSRSAATRIAYRPGADQIDYAALHGSVDDAERQRRLGFLDYHREKQMEEELLRSEARRFLPPKVVGPGAERSVDDDLVNNAIRALHSESYSMADVEAAAVRAAEERRLRQAIAESRARELLELENRERVLQSQLRQRQQTRDNALDAQSHFRDILLRDSTGSSIPTTARDLSKRSAFESQFDDEFSFKNK